MLRHRLFLFRYNLLRFVQRPNFDKIAKKAGRDKSKSKPVHKKHKKSSAGGGSSSGGSGSGQGPSASERLSWESGTGLPFDGSMAAQLVHAIMFRFILGDADLNQNYGKIDLLYHYKFWIPSPHDNESHVQYINVRRLIDVDIPDDAANWIENTNNRYNIFNPDEAMNADPARFLEYEGTLDQFVRDIANEPFNEVYWTHEEEFDHLDTIGYAQRNALNNLVADPYHPAQRNNILEQDYNYRIPHATLHFRQTPFQERDWAQLPIRKITNSDIIDFQLDRNDVEQKSIFNITNDGEGLENISNMLPVTDDRQELQRRYGYKYMDVTSDYFLNTSSFSGLSAPDLINAVSQQDKSTMPADAWITYPSVTTFNEYFGPDAASVLLRHPDPHLLVDLPLSPQEGGEELYNITLNFLNNHLQNIVDDEVNYEVANQVISYLSTYGSTKNPLSMENGGVPYEPLILHVNPEEFYITLATEKYQEWNNQLLRLRAITQNTNNQKEQNLDRDEQGLINNPVNTYTVYNTDTGEYEPKSRQYGPDPVITQQKAGELMVHYVLSILGVDSGQSSDHINSIINSSAVKALNPWLGLLKNGGSDNLSTPIRPYNQRNALRSIYYALGAAMRGNS